MQKIKSFFSNSVIVVILLVLGSGLVLFLSNQSFEPIPSSQAGVTPIPATPIDVVKSTRTPTVIPVIVTVFYTPTPAPSPTPTPTFEPLSDKPIMGFVFKPPQEISTTRNSVGRNEIVEWISENSEEILLKRPTTLNTVNVISGTTKEYARVNEPGNIYQPIWLTEENEVLYLSLDIQTNQQNLWVGRGDGRVEKILSDVVPPLIPLDEKSVGVSKRDSGIVILSNTKQGSVDSQPVPVYLSQDKPEQNESVVQSSNGDWLAYYNNPEKILRIIDTRNNEFYPVDFGQNKWVWLARWSPDGKKLALLVTEGSPPVDYSHLYILEWPANEFYQVDADKFNFVTEFAWAPNSNHLLFLPVIDYQDGVETIGLYITDISTTSEVTPIPIPVDGLAGYKGSLSWSPDGKKILVEYFNNRSEYSLYRIDVFPEGKSK